MNEKLMKIQKMVNPEIQREKLVVLISGEGTSGKDHLIKKINKYTNKVYAHNRSTIDVFKTAAEKIFEWDGRKDYDSRVMLHEFKEVFIKYNEFPTLQAVKYYNSFIEENTEDITNHPSFKKKCNVLFIHIREWEEIEKFKEVIGDKCKVITLLVKANKAANYRDKFKCKVVSEEEYKKGILAYTSRPTVTIDDCSICSEFSCIHCTNKDPGTENLEEEKFDIIFENNFNNISEQQFARLIESEFNKLRNEEKRYIYIVNDPNTILRTINEFTEIDFKTGEKNGMILNGSYSVAVEQCSNLVYRISSKDKDIINELLPGMTDFRDDMISIKDYTIKKLDKFFSIENIPEKHNKMIFGTPSIEENNEVYETVIHYIEEKGISSECVKRVMFHDHCFTNDNGFPFNKNNEDSKYNPDDFIHLKGKDICELDDYEIAKSSSRVSITIAINRLSCELSRYCK